MPTMYNLIMFQLSIKIQSNSERYVVSLNHNFKINDLFQIFCPRTREIKLPNSVYDIMPPLKDNWHMKCNTKKQT